MKTKILSILALLLTVTQGAWAQTNADKGRILAADGKMYKNVTLANKVSSARAVVAYVGDVAHYWDHCLCLALVDASGPCNWEGAKTAAQSWAASNSITLGSTTYATSHTSWDWASDDTEASCQTRTEGIGYGWRIPNVTDWRYIMAAYGGPSATSPVGVAKGVYGNTVRSAINTACGNTGLSTVAYWTCSTLSGSDPAEKWGVHFQNGDNKDVFWTYPLSQAPNLRLVFAPDRALTNGYVVEYNANGGSGAPAAQSKTHGTALTLSSIVPTRTGYTFLGWATSADGPVAYSAGGSYTTDNDIILYAKWAPTYTATFATGNDNEGWTIAPASGVEGATVTVSYSGENKVKSVTVQKRVAVGHELSSVSLGEIICSDGLAYAAADHNNLPAGVTASGMVVYLGAAGSVETGNSTYRGMAISLVDAPQVAGTYMGATTGPWADGEVAETDVDGIANVGGSYSTAVAELKGIANTAYMMSWWPYAYKFAHNRARNYAVAKPSGTSDWFEPTLGQWARMMDSFGGSFVSGTYDTKSATAVSNLNTALTNAGGTALSADMYWLSTEINNSEAAYFSASGGQFGYHGKATSHRVRAFFAF